MGNVAASADHANQLSACTGKSLEAFKKFLSFFTEITDDSGDPDRTIKAIIAAFASAVLAVSVYWALWSGVIESKAALSDADAQASVIDRAFFHWQAWAPTVKYFVWFAMLIPFFMIAVLTIFRGRARHLAGSLSSTAGFILVWTVLLFVPVMPGAFWICELFGWHGPTPAVIVMFAISAIVAVPVILWSSVRPITKVIAVPAVLFALIAVANGFFL